MTERQIEIGLTALDIVTDWVFSGSYNDSELFEVTYMDAGASPVGAYMYGRSEAMLPRDADGNKVPHPTMGNVFVGYDNYVICSGALTYSAEWGDSDMTRSEIEAYKAYIEAGDFAYDIENMTLTDDALTWDVVARDATEGSHGLIKYMPNCAFKCVIRDADTSLICFLRPLGDPETMKTGAYSIRGGESLTITKTGQKCFLAFSGDGCSVGGTAINNKAVKGLTSDSVTVDNTGTETRKIGLIWRD